MTADISDYEVVSSPSSAHNASMSLINGENNNNIIHFDSVNCLSSPLSACMYLHQLLHVGIRPLQRTELMILTTISRKKMPSIFGLRRNIINLNTEIFLDTKYNNNTHSYSVSYSCKFIASCINNGDESCFNIMSLLLKFIDTYVAAIKLHL